MCDNYSEKTILKIKRLLIYSKIKDDNWPFLVQIDRNLFVFIKNYVFEFDFFCALIPSLVSNSENSVLVFRENLSERTDLCFMKKLFSFWKKIGIDINEIKKEYTHLAQLMNSLLRNLKKELSDNNTNNIKKNKLYIAILEKLKRERAEILKNSSGQPVEYFF